MTTPDLPLDKIVIFAAPYYGKERLAKEIGYSFQNIKAPNSWMYDDVTNYKYVKAQYYHRIISDNIMAARLFRDDGYECVILLDKEESLIATDLQSRPCYKDVKKRISTWFSQARLISTELNIPIVKDRAQLDAFLFQTKVNYHLVALHRPAGDRFVLMAPSGAGKTFILGTAARLLEELTCIDLDDFGFRTKKERMNEWYITDRIFNWLATHMNLPILAVGISTNYEELISKAHQDKWITISLFPDYATVVSNRSLRNRPFEISESQRQYEKFKTQLEPKMMYNTIHAASVINVIKSHLTKLEV